MESTVKSLHRIQSEQYTYVSGFIGDILALLHPSHFTKLLFSGFYVVTGVCPPPASCSPGVIVTFGDVPARTSRGIFISYVSAKRKSSQGRKIGEVR